MFETNEVQCCFPPTPVIVDEEKPRSFQVDIVACFTEVVADLFDPLVFAVCQVIFIKSLPSFAGAEFCAFDVDDVHGVVHQAVNCLTMFVL